MQTPYTPIQMDELREAFERLSIHSSEPPAPPVSRPVGHASSFGASTPIEHGMKLDFVKTPDEHVAEIGKPENGPQAVNASPCLPIASTNVDFMDFSSPLSASSAVSDSENESLNTSTTIPWFDDYTALVEYAYSPSSQPEALSPSTVPTTPTLESTPSEETLSTQDPGITQTPPTMEGSWEDNLLATLTSSIFAPKISTPSSPPTPTRTPIAKPPRSTSPIHLRTRTHDSDFTCGKAVTTSRHPYQTRFANTTCHSSPSSGRIFNPVSRRGRSGLDLRTRCPRGKCMG